MSCYPELLIRNVEELVRYRSGELASLRRVALSAVEAGIRSVMPENFMNKLRLHGSVLTVDNRYKVDLREFDEVLVLGAGKAVLCMAEQLEKLLSNYISRGLIVVPEGLHVCHGLERIKAVPSTHPVPSALGLKAAQELLDYAETVGERTFVLFLLSGGASSLLPLPAPPLTLEDVAEVTKLLLKSGATIHEINAVRKHLSAISGGRLGKKLARGRVFSLILSDVVGDEIEIIGSGPTSPDSTTFKDVYYILRRYEIWEKVPEPVRRRVLMGLEGKDETPKPGDPAFKKITNIVIAGIGDACAAAMNYLKSRGFRCITLTRFMEGEASQVGIFLAGVLRELSMKSGKRAVICGGETTVVVHGPGLGGRNQELALSASIKMRGLRNCCLVSIGTDGIDGVSEAAGAIVDPKTYEDAINMGLNPVEFLRNNDSNTFFNKVGGAIYTGPTGTNVGDLTILLKC